MATEIHRCGPPRALLGPLLGFRRRRRCRAVVVAHAAPRCQGARCSPSRGRHTAAGHALKGRHGLAGKSRHKVDGALGVREGEESTEPSCAVGREGVGGGERDLG